MHTDIGTAYAADQVAHLITVGHEHARKQRDEADIERQLVLNRERHNRITGATRWLTRSLPCLPDGNPTEIPFDGGVAVMFAWPGLTIALQPGYASWATPTVFVGSVRPCCNKFVPNGPGRVFRELPHDVSETYAENWRLDLAAWIATVNETDPGPCPNCTPPVEELREPERRRITPLEMRLLGALNEYIRDQTPEAF